ncbi:MAG TPA: hypothetical protein VNT01_08100 [Symbiobacteriaceae bacterium]|nr:hypothetical protein [Symbiobacteriaceae bacterium]
MFEYTQSHSYELVKLRHDLMLREVECNRRNRQYAAALLPERKELRLSHVIYRVRCWMHRKVAGLARPTL